MPKFEVTVTVAIDTAVRVIVEAEDKESAEANATNLFSINAADAFHEKSKGWKASIDFKPPKGIKVAESKAKADGIQATSGIKGYRVKKVD